MQPSNPTNELRQRVKNLTKKIKVHYIEEKRRKVRRGIVPGNSKSLWRAVNRAKDMNSNLGKQDWDEISFQTKVPDLIQHITEDRLRHARGSVQSSSMLH